MGGADTQAVVSAGSTIRRQDYRPPAWQIAAVSLEVDVDSETQVAATLDMARSEADEAAPLRLDARAMDIDEVAIDGQPLAAGRWRHDGRHLVIDAVPARFRLSTRVRIRPEQNTALEGFYRSGPMYCTQCEAHGFSRITPYIDRPDVLSRFRVRLAADRGRFPVLLANGDLVASGDLPEGRHYAVWEDPFAKPCYLFAMVAGDLACVEDRYRSSAGRDIRLRFYVDHGNEALTAHAIDALKRAMRWDEETFGLHYDLDTYMVVAARAFNMGAMENKGLNIFNAAYVLASAETATDDSFHAVSAVIAHEYFHNWTGNRVTCRDWFQLSLKEGLTVYRDQRFSEDLLGAAVQRIDQVRNLRALQFPEDAGPTAHPVRPDAYQEVNNFYTATVYEKGAEIVRMLHTRIGEQAFRAGLQAYLARHDGSAATIEDFVAALSEAAGVDLSAFLAWYAQAGTPRLRLRREWQPEEGRLRLHFSQHTPATPGQNEKRPLPIPLRLRLRDGEGAIVPLPEHPARLGDDLLLMEDETLSLDIACREPLLPACLLGFSAPVVLETDLSALERQRLAVQESDPFVRWDAVQQLQAAAHAGLMRDDQGPLQALLVALQHIAAKPPEDDAHTAQLLAMPRTAWLWEQYDEVHPQRFVSALEALHSAIARALCGPLSVWVQRNPQAPQQWGARALVNLATDYLLALETESVRGLARRRAGGDHMTLAIGALQGLNRSRSAERALAMGEFRQRWQNQPLVLDRWFALAAASHCCDVPQLRALMADPAFDWGNPNRVRAVLASFARDNPGQFHSAEAYAVYAEALGRLDASNPQLAARLSRPLLGFRRLAEPWRSCQREVLRELRAGVQSLDLREMLDAALTDTETGRSPVG